MYVGYVGSTFVAVIRIARCRAPVSAIRLGWVSTSWFRVGEGKGTVASHGLTHTSHGRSLARSRLGPCDNNVEPGGECAWSVKRGLTKSVPRRSKRALWQ